MKNKIVLPIAVVVLGLAAFISRWALVVNGLDYSTGLLVKPHYWYLFLCICAITLVSTFFGSVVHSEKGRTTPEAFCEKDAFDRICLCVAAILMALAGAQTLGRDKGLFAILTAACMFLGAIGIAVFAFGPNKYRGRYLTGLLGPVIAACLWLLFYYRTMAINPIHADYLPDIVAYIVSLVAVYMPCTLSFTDVFRARMAKFFTSMGLILLICSFASHRGITAITVSAAFTCYLVYIFRVLVMKAEMTPSADDE